MKKIIAFSAGLLVGGLVCVAIKKTIDKKMQPTLEDEELANDVYQDLEEKYGDDTADTDYSNHDYAQTEF